MNAHEEICLFESQLIEALRDGKLPNELRAHAAVCKACTEAMMIHGFLESVAAASVPPPQFVYWKAELRARREQAELAMRPATVVQWLLLPVLAALVLGSLTLVGGVAMRITAGVFVLLLGAAVVVVYAKLGAPHSR